MLLVGKPLIESVKNAATNEQAQVCLFAFLALDVVGGFQKSAHLRGEGAPLMARCEPSGVPMLAYFQE